MDLLKEILKKEEDKICKTCGKSMSEIYIQILDKKNNDYNEKIITHYHCLKCNPLSKQYSFSIEIK